MTEVFTKEQKEFYLAHQGQKCPFCGLKERTVIAVSDFNADGNIGTQTVKCTHCKKAWVDVYELIDAMEER